MIIYSDAGAKTRISGVSTESMLLSKDFLSQMLLSGETVPEEYLLAVAAGLVFAKGNLHLDTYLSYLVAAKKADRNRAVTSAKHAEGWRAVQVALSGWNELALCYYKIWQKDAGK